jgi:phosphoglycolate phosphatase
MTVRRFRAAAAILDLDGTLLDTVPDLACAVNAMRAQLGLGGLATARVACFVGKGAEVLVHRAVTDDPEGRLPAPELRAALALFEHHYALENGRQAVAYPGVREGLARMRAMGLRLAVVTNKPQAFTGPLLARTGLAEAFEFFVGGDTLARRKPDPEPMLHASARLGLPPGQVLAIGDSINDALAARAAGMPVFAVPYGYNEGHDVRSLDVDAIVDSLEHAARLIDVV